MNNKFSALMVICVVLFAVFFATNAAWAIKNVCPECNFLVEDMEATNCPNCGRIINKCLICGTINPMKNDNCSSCHASLAESRIMGQIDSDTRKSLRLGKSDRAKIEVELGQIKDIIETGELTPEIAAREVELLTKMDWWAKSNLKAIEFAAKFPDSDKNILVTKCRVKSLRHLGFLAMEEDEYVIASDYLKTALELDPNDKKSANLLKMSQNQMKKK